MILAVALVTIMGPAAGVVYQACQLATVLSRCGLNFAVNDCKYTAPPLPPDRFQLQLILIKYTVILWTGLVLLKGEVVERGQPEECCYNCVTLGLGNVSSLCLLQ